MTLHDLQQLPAMTMVSLTIQCRLPADRPAPGSLPFEAYLEEMTRLLKPVKVPIVTALEAFDGVDVVDVPHTPFIVATAPAALWIQWTAPGGWISQAPGVTLLDEIEIRADD